MASKGYMKLSNDPSSSDTFIHDTFQQQEVSFIIIFWYDSNASDDLY